MQAMQRIGEALQRSQRGGGKASNYKTTSRWLWPIDMLLGVIYKGLNNGELF
jgi:hypothetical protein